MTTIRVWFTKTGEASYISLLDLQRVMQRALKRSGLPVWYTLGFNPHIYMTFAAPLSLGQESLAETVDFKSEAEGYDWDAAAPALSACLPRGIKVTRIAPAVLDAGDIACAAYEVRYAEKDAQAACAAWEAYNAAPAAEVVKEGKRGKKKTVDLKAHLPEVQLMRKNGGLVVCAFACGQCAECKPGSGAGVAGAAARPARRIGRYPAHRDLHPKRRKIFLKCLHSELPCGIIFRRYIHCANSGVNVTH